MRLFNKNLISPSFKIGQSRREFNASLLLSAVFVGSILFGLFLLKPKVQDDIGITKQAFDLDQRLAVLNEKAEALKKLDEDDLQQKVKEALKGLPTKKDIPQVIASVENLVRKNGLTPTSITIDSGVISTDSAKATQPQDKETIKVKLSLTGTYDNLRNFMTKTLSSKRLLALGNFSINSSEDNDFEFTIDLVYYYKPIAVANLDIATPVELLTDNESGALANISSYDYVSEPFQASASSRPNPFVKL